MNHRASEELGLEVENLLTDNGREYCVRPVGHPFELYLAIQQVEHRRTDIGSPETNGFCERFHRTVKAEFYAVAFRKTFYESLEQLQRDLRERPPGLPHARPHALPGVLTGSRSDA